MIKQILETLIPLLIFGVIFITALVMVAEFEVERTLDKLSTLEVSCSGEPIPGAAIITLSDQNSAIYCALNQNR